MSEVERQSLAAKMRDINLLIRQIKLEHLASLGQITEIRRRLNALVNLLSAMARN
jgi:hypothetical protein